MNSTFKFLFYPENEIFNSVIAYSLAKWLCYWIKTFFISGVAYSHAVNVWNPIHLFFLKTGNHSKTQGKLFSNSFYVASVIEKESSQHDIISFIIVWPGINCNWKFSTCYLLIEHGKLFPLNRK